MSPASLPGRICWSAQDIRIALRLDVAPAAGVFARTTRPEGLAIPDKFQPPRQVPSSAPEVLGNRTEVTAREQGAEPPALEQAAARAPATGVTRSTDTGTRQRTDRRRGVEKLRESEARKAAILDASLDAVITIDHQGLVVEFNSAAELLFLYRREHAIGRALVDLIVPPRLRDRALAGLAGYRATGESGLLGKRFTASAMKSGGAEFPVDVAMAPIGIGVPPLLTIYVSDATERKRAEQEVRLYQGRVRTLMADVFLAEERERRRLAVDLHDGLSQTIALTQIKLSALRVALHGRQSKSLDEIGALIGETNRAVRTIGFELSPPILHDLGLLPAVQWLVENIQARYGIEIALEDDGAPEAADEKTRVILFRSLRELLINAAKHSKAHRICVSIVRRQDQLDVSVVDDGVGMQPDLVAAKGSGLLSIHERLSHVGGSMLIASAPGRGTTIRLTALLAGAERVNTEVET